MRDDMSKVVIERPRWGSRRKSRKWGIRLRPIEGNEFEEQRKFVSSARRRQYGHDYRHSTDVLGPLRKFLRTNVGRPWNKVYSELCAGLDKRKTTGQHIFDHLRWEVETNCYIGADRKPYDHDRDRKITGFYVHPVTGLLCYLERTSARTRRKQKLVAEELTELKLDRLRSYRLLGDLWFLVTHEFVDGASSEKGTMFDVVHRINVKLKWGSNRVAIAKKQCNHDEVQDINQRIAAWNKQVRRM
jgi:hypothetical protein